MIPIPNYLKKYIKEGIHMKKFVAFILALTITLGLFGCKSQDSNDNTAGVPEDFSIALTWGVNGISSYDSATGKLVKTTDATKLADYVTYYELTEEDREYIYNLILALDVDSYPDTYDPGNGMSKPSMTLILTVHMDGVEKTIKADNIALSFTSKDKKGQLFLTTCKEIRDRLTATQVWQALPEYEKLYE